MPKPVSLMKRKLLFAYACALYAACAMDVPKKRTRRSQDWFGREGKDGFLHRSWIKNQGYPDDMFDGRPVIGICNTWSELTPCNGHFRELAEFVKRGVYEAGGFPLEFPGDVARRNAAASHRDVVPQSRQHGRRGIDPRQPDRRRGAAHGLRQDHAVRCSWARRAATCRPSAFPAARCCPGSSAASRSARAPACGRCPKTCAAGKMSQEEFTAAESCMHRSKGHCMTMGTASTMASMVEALGVALPGNAAIPAVDSRRYRQAQLTGRRIVEMVEEEMALSKILTRAAFENAIRVNAAIGGSTNAVIHLLAIAGRIGVPLKLEDWDKIGSELPCLLNLQPSGKYLMEDFYYAGGLPAVMKRDRARARRQGADRQWQDASARTSPTRRAGIATSSRRWTNLSRDRAGIAVLRGNLAPDGAVIKPSAASPHLLQAQGPRGGVREHRRSARAHRRRESRHRRTLHHGAQGLRPEGLSRHGGSGQHAAAAQTTAPWHHRHPAHLRRAHERHGLWRRGAARVARSRGRRAAGAGAQRRPDRSGRARAAPASRRERSRARQAARRLEAARRRPRAAGTSCTWITCSRRISAPISTCSSAAAAPTSPATLTRAAQNVPDVGASATRFPHVGR